MGTALYIDSVGAFLTADGQVNSTIRQIEADDKSSSLRKEYALLEKNVSGLHML